jgi:hypothetical protein
LACTFSILASGDEDAVTVGLDVLGGLAVLVEALALLLARREQQRLPGHDEREVVGVRDALDEFFMMAP